MSGDERGPDRTPRPAPPTVEIHIDRLVLHGFEGKDRHRVGEALERELARLFEKEGMPPALHRGGGVPHPGTGSFEMRPDAGSGLIGARVARAVYRGLNR